jgi:hypothetical protein
MKRPRFIVRNVGGKTPLGNKRGPWHVLDTERDDVMASFRTAREARIDANTLNDLLKDGCPCFKPDHNGECQLCDEWADAHSPAAIHEGELHAQTPSIPRGTKKL